MNKLYRFTDNETISREAGAWMVKLDGDEPLSKQDMEELREWLARSPAHREKLGNMVDMWGGMNVLTELSVPLGRHDTCFKHGGASRRFRLGHAIAGLVTVVVVLAIAFAYPLMPELFQGTNGQYVTAVGQQQAITLSDNSRIQLNTNSQVRVAYGDHYRDIHLQQGEAYFEVAKNEDKPFRVFAGNERVQAVGTAFTVHLKDRDLNVMVTEGRVALATLSGMGAETAPRVRRQPALPVRDDAQNDNAKNLGMLDAGQSATIKRSQASGNETVGIDSIEIIDREELVRRLAWRDGLLNFAGDPLEQVVEEISRYTTIVIRIDDPAVRALKIGGQFAVGDIDMMLDALEANFNLRIVHNGPNQVHILAAND